MEDGGEALLPGSRPSCDSNLLVFELPDAFLYPGDRVLRFLSVSFQPLLLLFFSHEPPLRRTAPAAAGLHQHPTAALQGFFVDGIGDPVPLPFLADEAGIRD